MKVVVSIYPTTTDIESESEIISQVHWVYHISSCMHIVDVVVLWTDLASVCIHTYYHDWLTDLIVFDFKFSLIQPLSIAIR